SSHPRCLDHPDLHSFPTRRSSDLLGPLKVGAVAELEGSEIRVRGHLKGQLETSCDRCLSRVEIPVDRDFDLFYRPIKDIARDERSEEHTSELQSLRHLVCRLLLEK